MTEIRRVLFKQVQFGAILRATLPAINPFPPMSRLGILVEILFWQLITTIGGTIVLSTLID